jgi:hypothetical protein
MGGPFTLLIRAAHYRKNRFVKLNANARQCAKHSADVDVKLPSDP